MSTIAEDFQSRTSPYRSELFEHCYRMLGSVHDAEDLVQETLLRAWRAFDRFDESRASLRTWLHRIATNACLNALESRNRRPLPSGLGAPDHDPDRELVPGREVGWLQPLPESKLGPRAADPAATVAERETLRLAFVAATQLLPARQRAVLILRDVYAFSASEVAETLGTSTAAVNSALQRARLRLDELSVLEEDVDEPSEAERRDLVDRYVAAFERADVAGLTRLLVDQVVLEMPPFRTWFLGREAYGRFISRIFALRGHDWRLVPSAANFQPTLAAYVRQDGAYHLHTLHVLAVGAKGITRITAFQDPEIFASFDLATVVESPVSG